jgi:hypothetical protein
MAVQKVLVLNANNQPQNYTPLQTSVGSGSAGAIPALNADGKIDSTMVYASEEVSYIAKSTISATTFVNTTNVSGTGEVQPALATDATKICTAFAPSGIASSGTGEVVFGGQITLPLAQTGYTFAAANIQQLVYLDPTNAGMCVPASTTFTTGQLIQSLGAIVQVSGSNMTIDFNPQIVAIA